MFAERMRVAVQKAAGLTVSAGVATVIDKDDVKTFLTRVDTALYAAKAAGRNTVYCHNGEDAYPASSQDLLATSTSGSGSLRASLESLPPATPANDQPAA